MTRQFHLLLIAFIFCKEAKIQLYISIKEKNKNVMKNKFRYQLGNKINSHSGNFCIQNCSFKFQIKFLSFELSTEFLENKEELSELLFRFFPHRAIP